MYKTKCNRCASVFFSVHSPEMKYTKRSAIGCIFQCSFTGNEMYKTKLPLFASKEKHVGKKHYLFLHKDFDRSKKLSQFTFNGQNFFFWLTPCLASLYTEVLAPDIYIYRAHWASPVRLFPPTCPMSLI